jgi:hypothetical protein
MSQSNKSMVFKRRSGALLVGAALALGANAQAQDSGKMFTVSGFGTLGAAKSSNELGDFVADQFQATGAGYSSDWSINVDSKLALQIDAKITDKLSAVVQVMSRSRTNNTFGPRVEWANIKYAFTPNLSVRVGRSALPVFMNSDTRLIGYAMTAIRPPIETYSLRSISNADGIDGAFTSSMFGATNTVNVYYAKAGYDIVNSSGTLTRGVDAKKMYGIVDTIEYGALTVRLGAGQFNVDVRAGATLFEVDAQVYNLGAIYDPGNWFVQGELTKSTFGALQRGQLAGYVTGGYRLNKFTPYATISRLKPNDDQVRLQLREQTSMGAGLRWDFMKNVDLKLQFERVDLANGSVGMLTNAKPGLAGGSTKVVSAVVDFVF